MKVDDFIDMCKNAIDAVVEQGEAGADKLTGDCLYITENGNCCLVGHMMPNDEVRKSFNTSVCASSAAESSLWEIDLDPTQKSVLDDLQVAHDNQLTLDENGEFDLTLNEKEFRSECQNILMDYIESEMETL